MSSFDPPTELPTWTSVNPRPFIPLQRHHDPLFWPSLPSPPRQPVFSNLYTLSTHIIPGAYPRVVSDVPLLERAPNTGITQEEWKRINAQKTVEILHAKQKQSTAEPVAGSEKLLWICVNRYVRRNLRGQTGLTLFFAHANGFPKEVGFSPHLASLVVEMVADLGTLAAIFAKGFLWAPNR